MDNEHSVSTSDPDNNKVEEEFEVSEIDRDLSFRVTRCSVIISLSLLSMKTTVSGSIDRDNSIFVFCIFRSLPIYERVRVSFLVLFLKRFDHYERRIFFRLPQENFSIVAKRHKSGVL
jgi:hypothetical protein